MFQRIYIYAREHTLHGVASTMLFWRERLSSYITHLNVITTARAPDICPGTSTGSSGRSTVLTISNPPAGPKVASFLNESGLSNLMSMMSNILPLQYWLDRNTLKPVVFGRHSKDILLNPLFRTSHVPLVWVLPSSKGLLSHKYTVLVMLLAVLWPNLSRSHCLLRGSEWLDT